MLYPALAPPTIRADISGSCQDKGVLTAGEMISCGETFEDLLPMGGSFVIVVLLFLLLANVDRASFLLSCVAFTFLVNFF